MYICAVSDAGIAIFDKAIFVVSGALLFGTTYKFAVTLPGPQLHMVNEVITVLPVLV
jgi:hypothetical protein